MTTSQPSTSAYIALAFAVLFLLVGMLVFLMYMSSNSHLRSLKKNGLPVEANITEHFQKSKYSSQSDLDNRNVDGPEEQLTHYIGYIFSLPDGTEVKSSYRLDKEEDYELYQIGDFVDVVYDEKNPESSYVSDIGLRENSSQIPHFLLVVLSVGGLLLYTFFRIK